MALVLSPPMELRSTPGAQKVTTREKIVHVSQPESELEVAVAPAREAEGLMRGTGGAPRSGRVSVLARRMVAEDTGGRVVGMGTSEES